jgi:hypothetical protein
MAAMKWFNKFNSQSSGVHNLCTCDFLWTIAAWQTNDEYSTNLGSLGYAVVDSVFEKNIFDVHEY